MSVDPAHVQRDPEGSDPLSRRQGAIAVLVGLLIFGVAHQVLSRLPGKRPADPQQEVTDATWDAADGHWRVRVLVEPKVAQRLEDGRLRAEVRLAASYPYRGGQVRIPVLVPSEWRGPAWARAEFTRGAPVGERVSGEYRIRWWSGRRPDPSGIELDQVMARLLDADGDPVGPIYEKFLSDRKWKGQGKTSQ